MSDNYVTEDSNRLVAETSDPLILEIVVQGTNTSTAMVIISSFVIFALVSTLLPV